MGFGSTFHGPWLDASGAMSHSMFGEVFHPELDQAPGDGILAYYDYPISTGPLEGTNNKIKTMKRQAYGFRDQEFFKLRILAIHETKYALVG